MTGVLVDGIWPGKLPITPVTGFSWRRRVTDRDEVMPNPLDCFQQDPNTGSQANRAGVLSFILRLKTKPLFSKLICYHCSWVIFSPWMWVSGPGDLLLASRIWLSGFTLQACKSCDCLTSRVKKELGDSNRDRASYMCETKRPGATSHYCKRPGRIRQPSSLLEKNEATSYRGIDIRFDSSISYQGNHQLGHEWPS